MKIYECSSCNNNVAAIKELIIICKCGNRMYEILKITHSRYFKVKNIAKGVRRW